MENQKITEWLEWRYPEVFKDFKKFVRAHDDYCPDNGIHGQNLTVLIGLIMDYFKKYNLTCKSTFLDKPMRGGFSHINTLLK